MSGDGIDYAAVLKKYPHLRDVWDEKYNMLDDDKYYALIMSNTDFSPANILKLVKQTAEVVDDIYFDGGRHILLDELLCQLLISLGHGDIVKEYNKPEKYYV